MKNFLTLIQKFLRNIFLRKTSTMTDAKTFLNEISRITKASYTKIELLNVSSFVDADWYLFKMKWGVSFKIGLLNDDVYFDSDNCSNKLVLKKRKTIGFTFSKKEVKEVLRLVRKLKWLVYPQRVKAFFKEVFVAESGGTPLYRNTRFTSVNMFSAIIFAMMSTFLIVVGCILSFQISIELFISYIILCLLFIVPGFWSLTEQFIWLFERRFHFSKSRGYWLLYFSSLLFLFAFFTSIYLKYLTLMYVILIITSFSFFFILMLDAKKRNRAANGEKYSSVGAMMAGSEKTSKWGEYQENTATFGKTIVLIVLLFLTLIYTGIDAQKYILGGVEEIGIINSIAYHILWTIVELLVLILLVFMLLSFEEMTGKGKIGNIVRKGYLIFLTLSLVTLWIFILFYWKEGGQI